MTKHIQSALKKIVKGSFINILLSTEHYAELAGSKLTSHLIEMKKPLIYITSYKPSKLLQKNLSKKEKESVFFIDMVSGSGSVFSKTEGNTLYMSAPESLTEMGISLFSSDVFKGKNRTIVLDSIPSLIEKNGEDSVREFIGFIRQKVESTGDSGLLISIVDEDDDPASEFASGYCHEIVRVKRE